MPRAILDSLYATEIAVSKGAGSFDTMERFRTAEPFCLWDVKHDNGIQSEKMDDELLTPGTSSAESVWEATADTDPYISMRVTGDGTNAATNIHKSFEYIAYQPAKAREFHGTVVLMDAADSNAVARMGMFDEDDGAFFEMSNDTMYVVIRNQGVEVTRVAQSAWNLDKLDGVSTNAAGKKSVATFTAADWRVMRIFSIRLQWFGGGDVVFGIVANQKFHGLHVETHSGFGDIPSTTLTAPYCSTAALPVRYEISTTTAAQREMRMVCAAVDSLGGFLPMYKTFTLNTANGGSIDVACLSTAFSGALAIRISPTASARQKRMGFVLTGLSVVTTSASKEGLWGLYHVENGRLAVQDYLTDWTALDVGDPDLTGALEYANTAATLAQAPPAGARPIVGGAFTGAAAVAYPSGAINIRSLPRLNYSTHDVTKNSALLLSCRGSAAINVIASIIMAVIM